MSALLVLDDVHAYYGRSHIVQGVNLHVAPGEIVGVLGRNGAGRSTLMKAIIGQVDRTGDILFSGQAISHLPTYEIARLGIAYIPEHRDIFPTLTVHQNLILGQNARGQQGEWTSEHAYTTFPLLEKRRDVLAGRLSGGEQQLLALARAMMGNPRLLLIDEPTEGLSPMMVQLVTDFLRKLQAQGIAILLIEQKQNFILQVAQRLYVMGRGQVVFEGTPAQFSSNDIVKEWLEV
jgi:branched-chain amino acid transport system ATP-binding protein